MADVKSFDELLEGIPDIDGILKTFSCYEEKGALDYFKFTQIIDLDLLYLKELRTAFTNMQRALERQIEKNENLVDGLAYLQAMNYIAKKLMEKTDYVDPMPESTRDNSNFTYLNTELFLAHKNKSIEHLNNALFEFKEYVRDVKPDLFKEEQTTYHIPFLNNIQVTKNLEII